MLALVVAGVVVCTVVIVPVLAVGCNVVVVNNKYDKVDENNHDQCWNTDTHVVSSCNFFSSISLHEVYACSE